VGSVIVLLSSYHYHHFCSSCSYYTYYFHCYYCYYCYYYCYCYCYYFDHLYFCDHSRRRKQKKRRSWWRLTSSPERPETVLCSAFGELRCIIHVCVHADAPAPIPAPTPTPTPTPASTSIHTPAPSCPCTQTASTAMHSRAVILLHHIFLCRAYTDADPPSLKRTTYPVVYTLLSKSCHSVQKQVAIISSFTHTLPVL
jgi:hypothetical protein